jgi:hypothetical protein
MKERRKVKPHLSKNIEVSIQLRREINRAKGVSMEDIFDEIMDSQKKGVYDLMYQKTQLTI